jgi:lipid-binding SYLF domain-containing protein
MKSLRAILTWAVAVAISWAAAMPGASAADRSQLDRDARSALNKLVAGNAGAKAVGAKAVAVLVFPSITKAGLVIGGQTGDGVLMMGGKTIAYYNTSGASYGLQAGAQTYGYAMFFMNESTLKQLDKTDGFEVGVGPSVVVADEGFAKSTTSVTYDQDIYAFIFSQKGLMAGLGLQGNKITRLAK